MKVKLRPKEVSWLAFNARVLQEAANPDVPLLERIKFLGIYSSNLDEFFRVRVATLRRLSELGSEAKKVLGHNPKKVLKQIQGYVLELNAQFNATYRSILKALARKHIYIINEKELTARQATFVRKYFALEVRPNLFPIMLKEDKKLPEMRDESIYLAVCLYQKKDKVASQYALIEVPSENLPRFIQLPKTRFSRHIIFLDDVIRLNLKQIFSILDYTRFEAYTIKITRDAELDMDDYSMQSYIKQVSQSLKQRKEGSPVRFIYDAKIPNDLLNFLIRKLNLSGTDTLIPGARYHNFKDFMAFPDYGRKDWKYPIRSFLPHPDFERKRSLLAVIENKDVLLHYPYQPFHYMIDLLREASIDPDVTSIKITLYRLAKNSSIINALINARKNGKSVLVILELQARFDEEANIFWGNKLREEGVKVLFGITGLKVHSKLVLITKKVQKKLYNYAVIGTGNFNENTARLYTDHSLFTTDSRLTSDVCRVFDFLESNYNVQKHKHLLVSPLNMRSGIQKLIRREIKKAETGQPASIFIKCNNLTDEKIIKLLYKASRAGVSVRLIVRSMFSLIPGVEGMSENIEAISIVDKYLEHTRIFYFGYGDDEKIYITSADLMPRNIDKRVEVTCPIYEPQLKAELKSYMEIQWQDNVRARILDESLSNTRKTDSGDGEIRAQWDIYETIRDFSAIPDSVYSEAVSGPG